MKLGTASTGFIWAVMLSLPMVCQAAPPASGMVYGKDALQVCSSEQEQSILNCISWINGAVQGAHLTFTLSADKPRYCTPETGGSLGQYRDVFVKFLRENPAKRHELGIYLFHQAMAQAFPCDQRS